MNKAYSSLADWFEYLNADCDYEQWSQYLYGRLRGLGIEGGRGRSSAAAAAPSPAPLRGWAMT